MKQISGFAAVGIVAAFSLVLAAGCGGDGTAGTDDGVDAGVDVAGDVGTGDAADDADSAGRDTWDADDTGVDGWDADDEGDTDDATDNPDSTDTTDTTTDTGAYWADLPYEHEFQGFDRADYDPILGWILLDYNPDTAADQPTSIESVIDTAATYGVNHIQLSHDIVMNVDELLGDDAATAKRVDFINRGIARAHEKGMKVYLWAHEFQAGDIVVCYGPDGAIWDTRATAYQTALAKVPGVDGIILMFGSAGASPWYTLCDCDWCSNEFPGEFTTPPQDVKIQLVVEHIASVLESLGKKMIVRVFAHEPEENPWHADGLARARNVEFTAMHKSEVQDWQPYNPHDPTLGQVGAHPSILETDSAGEYFGRSELPFASPMYYRYRLKYAYDQTAIGAVSRISRGSDTALGTPNEVNLLTIKSYVQNQDTTIDQVWDEFIRARYLPPERYTQADRDALIDILNSSLTVMTKSHYVLGLWALEKGSDIPAEPSTEELGGRGNMSKWDADWTDIFNAVMTPTWDTVNQIYVEASEGVEIAKAAFDAFKNREWNLSQEDQNDLYRRLNHQYFAARAFRAVKTYIFARKSAVYYPATAALVQGWANWARVELADVADEMDAQGLSDVSLVSPARIRTFLAATTETPDVNPMPPAAPATQPIYFTRVGTDSIDLKFQACVEGLYTIEYGTEFPHWDHEQAVVEIDAILPECEWETATISGLAPDTRYIFRLRNDGIETYRGGDFWEMTRNVVAQ